MVLGIGDDCAVLDPPAAKQLVTTMDTLVAGRHFTPDVDPEALGHKSLAVNLSDLAAMGAQPAWAMLALTVPEVDEQWLAAFASGFASLAAEHDVQLVGGDTTRGPLSISIQVQGFVDPGMALRRDGAHPGDLVYVTGELGLAALELSLRQKGQLDWCADALDRPCPRVREGMLLAGIASSAIDISDGLLADLGHICASSGTGANIQCAKLPLHQMVEQHIRATGDWSLPLSGGDDYQLCFTVPPRRQQQLDQIQAAQGVSFSKIGQVESVPGIRVILPGGESIAPAVSGFDHFR